LGGENRKMEKKFVLLVSLSLVAILALVMLGGTMENSPGAILKVYGQSQPDIYGNKIRRVEILKYNASVGVWQEVAEITNDTYTDGMTIQVPANIPLKISVTVYLNKTLAPDGATAESRAKVFVTGEGYWNNYELPEKGASDAGNFWSINCYTMSSNFTLPTDASVSCTVEYQAYY